MKLDTNDHRIVSLAIADRILKLQQMMHEYSGDPEMLKGIRFALNEAMEFDKKLQSSKTGYQEHPDSAYDASLEGCHDPHS